MASKSMAYDHPTYVTRHCAPFKLPATAASTTVQKFIAFTAMKVKSISLVVDIAGTSTGAYLVAQQGTGTALTLPTLASASGFFVGSQVDITLASGGWIDIMTNGGGGTVACSGMIEYEIIAGANVAA
jgi:hypothetical protein